jgi:ATP-binding cassette subfamily C (CFTR/MRP) protein 4
MEDVTKIRAEEIGYIRKASTYRAINESIFFSSSAVVNLVTFSTIYLLGGQLTAAKVFSTVSYLQTARITMTNFFAKGVQSTAECKIASNRLNQFFSRKERTLDEKNIMIPDAVIANLNDPSVYVYIQDASFAITDTNAEKSHATLHNIFLQIRRGELVGVCGPVGSGKTALMNAILGEIPCISGQIGLRNRNIAYVPQKPWILNGTLEENILFGKPLRREWFWEVIKACALDADLDSFVEKEKTILSENGSNLSGGQKARIALARAVYANAEIYLLDDPLSAVDAKVGKHLFKYCFRGILRKKVVWFNLGCTSLLAFD